jgi:hypothetical protein
MSINKACGQNIELAPKIVGTLEVERSEAHADL